MINHPANKISLLQIEIRSSHPNKSTQSNESIDPYLAICNIPYKVVGNLGEVHDASIFTAKLQQPSTIKPQIKQTLQNAL